MSFIPRKMMPAMDTADLDMRDHLGDRPARGNSELSEFSEPNLACAVAIERVYELYQGLSTGSPGIAGQRGMSLLVELQSGLKQLQTMVRELSIDNAKYSILYGRPGDALEPGAGESVVKTVMNAMRQAQHCAASWKGDAR